MKSSKELFNKFAETNLWRTFSIFISSTFADIQAERDHLKNMVFPKVATNTLPSFKTKTILSVAEDPSQEPLP